VQFSAVGLSQAQSPWLICVLRGYLKSAGHADKDLEHIPHLTQTHREFRQYYKARFGRSQKPAFTYRPEHFYAAVFAENLREAGENFKDAELVSLVPTP
jgi:hypothetical protein